MTRDLPGNPVVRTPPSNAQGAVSIPDQGTKIPHAVWHRTANGIKKLECLFAKKKTATTTHQTLHHIQRLTKNGS